MRSPISFVPVPDANLDQILESVEDLVDLAGDREESLERVFFDTFDWRIHRAGGTVETCGDELIWRNADGSVRRRDVRSGAPGLAEDLSPGPLREEIAPVIRMRRLLPVVAVRTATRLFVVLDRREKTVVRVAVETGTAADSRGGEPVAIRPRIGILPLRGYDSDFDRMAARLRAQPGLAPEPGTVLDRALAAVGREAEDYSSKLAIPLDPARPAADATRTILRRLFETMRRNEDGVKKDLDSEFLHDFRVAGRRTRSALGQIRGVFRDGDIEPFKEGFKWLGGATGPVRDLDVYLLKFDGYRDSLPESARPHLEPLRAFLVDRQRREQRVLTETLESDRYRRLVKKWRKFLKRSGPDDAPNARRPVFDVACNRISKAWKRVIKRGRVIDDTSPDESLHRLRIDCKKLRYLLEFFRSLYRTDEIEPLIGELKRLQDNLGDFNDYTVQQASLRSFAREMSEAGTTPIETVMAMGRLIERLELGQLGERRAFGERFERFAGKEVRKAFERLFGGGAT